MRSQYSVPERIGTFGLAVGAAALAWPVFTATTGLGAPCPLRWLTGVPCPACGLTTASVALTHGHPGAAFAANPAIYGLAALAVAVVPLLALRQAGLIAPPKPWTAAGRRRMAWFMVLVALASWAFQLHRLGIV